MLAQNAPDYDPDPGPNRLSPGPVFGYALPNLLDQPHRDHFQLVHAQYFYCTLSFMARAQTDLVSIESPPWPTAPLTP